VGSYLRARECNGQWLIRMEDIDPPREQAGAARAILSTLQSCGLVSDQSVLFQHTRLDAYAEALQRLQEERRCYPCACSRRDLPANGVYPGTCRAGLPAARTARTLRLRTKHVRIAFQDRLQGLQRVDLEATCGDFVLRRADGLYAYQLAVVVDDAHQGITEVVRGTDLLESTPRQIALQQALAYTTPAYMHLPVAVGACGHKLSKRTLAKPITHEDPLQVLPEALRFFGFAIAHEPHSLADFWRQAMRAWSSERLPRVRCIQAAAAWQMKPVS